MHSGKKIHHRHTSHGFLLLTLALTGALLFSNVGALKAFSVTKAGSIHVSVNVLGNPPTAGADISFPVNNSITEYSLVSVTGSCPEQTLVVIYNNGQMAGSTVCSSDTFSITVQLTDGINVLQAQNYDGLDQAGPATSPIIIQKLPNTATETPSQEAPAEPTPLETTVASNQSQVIPSTATLTDSNFELPSIPNSCTPLDETPINSKEPRITVGCITRSIFAGETLSLPLVVKGGLAPFALAVDWGDSKQDLITVLDSHRKVLSHTYVNGGFHSITLKATDSNGTPTQVQTTVSVNGEPTTDPVVSTVDKIVNTAKSVWVEAPIPLYFAALTLAIGFWIGDIFQRSSGKYQFVKQPAGHVHGRSAYSKRRSGKRG